MLDLLINHKNIIPSVLTEKKHVDKISTTMTQLIFRGTGFNITYLDKIR